MRYLVPVIALLAAPACSDDDADDTGPAPIVFRVTLAPSTGIAATPVVEGGFTDIPDTAVSPDGSTFYFIGFTAGGNTGVYSTPASGGTITPIATKDDGAAFVAPIGLVVSSDGQTIYIADPSVGVHAQPVNAAAAEIIEGTECMNPRAVELDRPANDSLYIAAGPGACGRGAGVAFVSSPGDAATFIVTGAPFDHPNGIVVTNRSLVLVANGTADGPGAGTILSVDGPTVTELVPSLNLGYRAGLAMTLDNTTLIASGYTDDAHAQVYAVNVATKAVATYNNGIGESTIAGGLHRAADVEVFGWMGGRIKN